MSFRSKTSLWFRVIHRDLGYFVVGMTIVYAISGILLNHRDGGNPSIGKNEIVKEFPKSLDRDNLANQWKSEIPEHKINLIIKEDECFKIYTDGGIGKYNVKNGNLTITFFYEQPIYSFINKLHYNQQKSWTPVADFFASSLILLAISGLFIVKGKKGFLKRGIWLMALGILVILLYI